MMLLFHTLFGLCTYLAPKMNFPFFEATNFSRRLALVDPRCISFKVLVFPLKVSSALENDVQDSSIIKDKYYFTNATNNIIQIKVPYHFSKCGDL